MSSARVMAYSLALFAALLVAGCGSSGSGTTAGAGSGSTTGDSSGPVPVIARGIKGESPTEVATTLHISRDDCGAIARLAESRVGVKLSRKSKPTPPLSECHLSGRGVSLNVFLDTGHGANQRYTNRMVETVQFNADHPAGLPQPVPNVGEKSYMNSAASWIPALGSLLAVRGPRWLTVTISADGFSGGQLRDEAATLARAGFKLTAPG